MHILATEQRQPLNCHLVCCGKRCVSVRMVCVCETQQAQESIFLHDPYNLVCYCCLCLTKKVQETSTPSTTVKTLNRLCTEPATQLRSTCLHVSSICCESCRRAHTVFADPPEWLAPEHGPKSVVAPTLESFNHQSLHLGPGFWRFGLNFYELALVCKSISRGEP